jgi:farnesol dehydrogenase
MHVLVTGATGFVGRGLVRRLVEDSWRVSLVTRNRSRVTIRSTLVDIYEADVSNAASLATVADTCGRVDAVIHLAATMSYYDKQDTYATNVAGTANVLEIAKRLTAGRFIYASSIEAVGPVALAEVPAAPDTPPRPVSAYGASKVAAERLVIEAASNRFPAVILRIGNVYGPGHASFLSDIIEAIITRNRLLEFLPVYADRYIHPIHTRDVTEGILAACRPEVQTSTLILGGEYATVGSIFEMCSRMLGRPLPRRPKRMADELFLLLRREHHRRGCGMDFITYLMAPSGRRIHRAYSMEETYRALGLTDQVPLEEGAAQTLAWMREEGLVDADGGGF